MDDKGVFAVARSIWDSSDFAPEPFSQREAWMWLIGAAAWRSIRVRGCGGPVVLQRAEFCFSVRFLAERWRWSKSRVERVISMLENRDMIRDTSRDGSKVYFINNYNDYQFSTGSARDSDRDTKRDTIETRSRHDRDKEEELNTLRTEEQERAAPKGAVVVAAKLAHVPSPPLPDWLDREAWSGFVEMRRKARKPMTQRAVGLILAKLDRWRMAGHDPTEILDKSTASNWTDVYEPKPDGRANGTAENKYDKFILGIGAAVAARNGTE